MLVKNTAHDFRYCIEQNNPIINLITDLDSKQHLQCFKPRDCFYLFNF